MGDQPWYADDILDMDLLRLYLTKASAALGLHYYYQEATKEWASDYVYCFHDVAIPLYERIKEADNYIDVDADIEVFCDLADLLEDYQEAVDNFEDVIRCACVRLGFEEVI